MFIQKMKEELVIINSSGFKEAKKNLESQIEYQRAKMEKFEFRFSEILKSFKTFFSDQTKELILSHGERFISVNNTNPFA